MQAVLRILQGYLCLYSTKYTLMLSILAFGFGSVKQPGIKPTIYLPEYPMQTNADCRCTPIMPLSFSYFRHPVGLLRFRSQG